MLETTDIVLRTVVVMAALILSSVLLGASGRRQAAVSGGLLSLSVAAFFVTSIPGAALSLGVWNVPLVAICVTKAVWFWLFARTLFKEGAKILPHHVALALLVAIVGVWQQTIFIDHYLAGVASTLESVIGLGFDAIILLFVLLGLREAWIDLENDLVEGRRRLRLGFIAATGAYLILTLAVQIWNLVNQAETAVVVMRINMILVTAVMLTAAWFLLQWRNRNWLEPLKTNPKPVLSRVETAVLAQLERALEHDRIYLEEGLTIGGLSRQLGTSEQVLRQVINRGMGHRNFNDFLHAWRIQEACEELVQPEQAQLPVLTIAMKVGYGSIGAFNRAFKARVGMTPTDYRRHQPDITLLRR